MKAFFLRFSLSAILVCLFLSLSAQQMDVTTAGQDLNYLASDQLQGRKPGTPGGDEAAAYILKRLQAAQVQLLGTNGYQDFEVVTAIDTGAANRFYIADSLYKLGRDYMPFSFSSNTQADAEVVVVGYGFDFETDSLQIHDYAGIDVKGKWVLILRGNPEPENENSLYAGYSKDRSKVLVAKDKGAAGVLLVSGYKWEKSDELVNLYYDKSKTGSGIPVINIKRSLADVILASGGKTIADIEKSYNPKNGDKPFEIGMSVRAAVDLKFSTVTTRNVVGIIPGYDPTLKDQYIIIGAHYDHLGMGGPGSGSRQPDTLAVHNGADDNASGVVALLQLADKLNTTPRLLRHTVVFIAFGAEELGLLGSSYFVAHPLVDMHSVMLMVNMDMVGRLDPQKRSLAIGGTGTFRGATEMLDAVCAEKHFKTSYSPEGYGPSDHAPFYADSIPVLYFNTGAHQDYHTPADDADRVNVNGVVDIAGLVYDVLNAVDQSDSLLCFLEAGPKAKARHGGALKVRLGIMPDFVNTEVEGVSVGAVTKGGPAEHGGILKGDVITALNGKPVQNIYDYMDRLKTFSPGQTISVDLLREGEKVVVLVQL